jgi:hypothetical protein
MPNLVVQSRRKYQKKLSVWEYRRYYPLRWFLRCLPWVFVAFVSLEVVFRLATGLGLFDVIGMTPRTNNELLGQTLVMAAVFLLIFSPVLFIVPRKK